MIALHPDCLLVAQTDGGYLPCSAEQLTLEVTSGSAGLLDSEILKHAAAAVLHYFREELGRNTITVAEFSAMLARVLNGLGINAEISSVEEIGEVRIADLRPLARVVEVGGELEFCLRLRTLLREQLAAGPLRLEFHGLRSCVKQLAGRKHWCPTCDRFEAWIIELIRGWFERDAASRATALVVR